MLKLREYRLKANMSLVNMAQEIGKTPVTVSRYESGKREPDIATLIRISEVLGVSLDELLGREEDHAEAEEDRGGETAGRVGGGGQEAEGPDLRVARDDGPHPGGTGGDDGPEPGDDVQPAGAAGDLAPGGTEKIKIHYRRGGDIVMTYEKVYWQEGPIVNADRWMKWEALRIFMNTLQAAKLANKSIRKENRRIRRTQRGKWM